MVEAKLLRKKLKNGLIVDKWDLVTIIEKQQAEIEALKAEVVMYRTDAEKLTMRYVDAVVSPQLKTLTDEEIIRNFLAKQTQLPPEFLKVLHDNLWNLYES
jgi:hypothetical protein